MMNTNANGGGGNSSSSRYIVIDDRGRESEPMDMNGLYDLARQRRLQPDTMIFDLSDNGWNKAAQIPALRVILQQQQQKSPLVQQPQQPTPSKDEEVSLWARVQGFIRR